MRVSQEQSVILDFGGLCTAAKAASLSLQLLQVKARNRVW